MRPWTAIFLVPALAALLWWAAPAPGALTAHEADALEAGYGLADALTADATPEGGRLGAGFQPSADNPRLAPFPPERPDRRAVAEPPTPTWLVAAALTLAPVAGEAPNAERARFGAALAVALALACLLFGFGRAGGARSAVGAGALAAAILLLTPGVLDAAAASGAAAASMLSMAALVVSTRHLNVRRRAWPAALAWAATLGVHPAAAFLVVPIFVAYAAAARPDPGGPAGQGEARMPSAPLGLYALPVVGIAAFVAAWPALWEATGPRLMAWFVDTWWSFHPPYEVAGVTWHQAANRAAPAWAALGQWLALTPPPIVLAFGAGAWAHARAGRGADWFPLLAWITLMLAGAADGSLFGGRLNLLALLWVPTAIVAARGVTWAAARIAAWRPALSPARVAAGLAAAVLAWPFAALALGDDASFGGVGAELARPLPGELLTRIDAETPWASVHIAPEPSQWRPGIAVARDHLALRLGWSEAASADWLVLVGPGAPPPGLAEGASAHDLRGRALGVEWRAWRRAP